jgi:hypothetical protein
MLKIFKTRNDILDTLPKGLFKLVKGIRDIENALSIPMGPRELFGGELSKMKSLRK